jgi:large exoprotein involved in heme utilization and adhesion
LGNIELEHSSINVSNTANSSSVGQVFVQANDFVLKGSIIVDNYSEQDAAEPSLKIETNNLTVKDGSVISASTYGQGNSGDVLLNAAESVIFTGESTGQYDGNTRISVMALEKSTGDAGKLIINSNNILFSNGAQINTTTYGSGRGGDLLLNAKENVEFSGDGNGFIKAASCSTGDAGNIEINADNILFADGVELDSATYDKGKGGAVSLNANEKVSVDGRDGRNGRRTKLQVSTGGTGDAGSLVINAKKIEVSNSAHIDSSTTYKREGGGKGGTVELNAVNIEFNNGAWLYSESTAQGQGGTLILNAANNLTLTDGSLISADNNLTLKDGSLISADTFGQGKSGDVSLNAGNNLTLTNGSVISASTVGHGNSGDVSLNAGNNLTLKNDSFILAITIGQGNSGDVSLNAANNLTLTDGSFILANTGVGSSGDVLLYAAESVIFGHYGGDISIITAAHESTGDAGKVIINANNILLSNGAYMNTTTYGSGRGGDMLLNAKKNVEFSGDGHGFIKAASCSTGDAGNIEINADNILFADGVELDSATYGRSNDSGKGGTVNLNANEKVSVDGRDGHNGRSTKLQVSSGGTGDAGSLVINAKKNRGF